MTATTEEYTLTPEEELSFLMWDQGVHTLTALEERGPVNEEDKWLIPGLVSTTSTFIYGESMAGKSFLVSQIAASLVDGRSVLGIEPYQRGLKVLLIANDSGGELEYQERIANLKTNTDNVFIVEKLGRLTDSDWNDMLDIVELAGIDVVVLDHATAELSGDSNHREPWVELWNRLNGFDVARVLVGHATDSRYDGKKIKRPMGNAAATQLPRARVHLFAPGDVRSPKRVLELDSNLAFRDPIQCRRGEGGYIELDEEANETQRQRSTKTVDQNKALKEAALAAPGGKSQKETCKWIAQQPGVEVTAGTARTKLNRRKDLKWDRNQKKYVQVL